MNKFIFLLSTTLIILCLSACKKEEVPVADLGVVINELMPFNSNVVADQNGEYDDWIELYNLSDKDFDLSGYYLTDSKNNLAKWRFPEGTLILTDSFLCVWADGDTLQSGLHTNYKLSTLGETVLFLTPEFQLVDRVSYDEQLFQLSFARIPNGTGDFSWVNATFNYDNVQIK